MTAQLRSGRLSEQLAAQVCRDIVSHRLEVGATLPSEPALVTTHGVSKTVVRETIQALSAVGLVRIQQGKRTIVLPEEEWNILSPLLQHAYREEGLAGQLVKELYAVRKILEPMAARWAAERASEAGITETLEVLETMRAAADGHESRRFLDFDRDFHFVISNSSGNRVLRAIIRDIHELVQTSWLLTALSDDEMRTVFQQHTHIAEAITNGDPEAAEAAMREHLEWAAQTDRFTENEHAVARSLPP